MGGTKWRFVYNVLAKVYGRRLEEFWAEIADIIEPEVDWGNLREPWGHDEYGLSVIGDRWYIWGLYHLILWCMAGCCGLWGTSRGTWQASASCEVRLEPLYPLLPLLVQGLTSRCIMYNYTNTHLVLPGSLPLPFLLILVLLLLLLRLVLGPRNRKEDARKGLREVRAGLRRVPKVSGLVLRGRYNPSKKRPELWRHGTAHVEARSGEPNTKWIINYQREGVFYFAWNGSFF